ncbi:MAG: hypothetical protein M3336_10005 [Chloroflexota bacterium]|nr:hypothetical protein [Chloroflexota bacterium]
MDTQPDNEHSIEVDHVDVPQPGHADTGSAAGVGGVTGAALGSAVGPIGAVVGAVGGMIVGAAAERAMHASADEDATAQGTVVQDEGVETPPPPE